MCDWCERDRVEGERAVRGMLYGSAAGVLVWAVLLLAAVWWFA